MGDYEFRIRLDNDWTDNWGQGSYADNWTTYQSSETIPICIDDEYDYIICFDTTNEDYTKWDAFTVAVEKRQQDFTLDGKSVGIISDFTNWGDEPDIQMTDEDGDGIYQAVLDYEYIPFDYNVRLDNEWEYYWGESLFGLTSGSDNGYMHGELVQGYRYVVSFDTRNADYRKWTITGELVEKESSEYEYRINDDRTVTITKYNGTEKNLVIPDTIDGYPVYAIGEGAFQENQTLKTVVVPEGVEDIQNEAFVYCTALEKVVLPNTVGNIGIAAFAYCESLQEFNIPVDVWYLPEKAFTGCTSLTKVEIPDNVYEIGAYAFYGCTSLETVIFPKDMLMIGDNAFAYCDKIKSLQLPEMENLGFYAFSYCTGLESVTIPDGIFIISEGAFFGCTSFESVTIPENVQYVEDDAFTNCTAMKYLIAQGEWTYFGEYAVGFTSETVNNAPYHTPVDGFGVYCHISDDCNAYAYALNVNTDYDEQFKICPFLENTSDVSEKTVAKGENIVVNASAQGGSGGYTYAVQYKAKSDTKWTTAQAFKTNATVKIPAAKEEVYNVCIKIKDSNGLVEKKYINVTVKNIFKNNSTISKQETTVGNIVEVNASAVGENPSYQYAVYYKQATQST